MKRAAFYVLIMAFLLSACIPTLPTQQVEQPLPTVNIQATSEALAATQAAETLNSLPTPTLEPPTNTPEPTATPTETGTATATETATTDPNATVTDTSIPVLNVTGTATVTGTPPTPTPTETLHVRFYGTLPPAIPYGKVRLNNRSKAEAYISLQCITVDGYNTILEYPVAGRMRVSAPAGKYTYVAWIGGRQFQGWFGLGKNNEVEITLYKDKVTIK